MQISHSNYSNKNFTGATRTLRRNYFATAEEICDVFAKHPKSDGIAGSLPHSWIKNLISQPKEQRGEAIKSLYKLFRESFGENNNDPKQLSERFTAVLRDLNIIPKENQIIIKKRKLDGSVLRGAYTIQERGKKKTLEPLFIKQFIEKKHSRNSDGILAEIALGLHFHRLVRNEHILRPYFGDTIAKFMVSKYEITPQNVKIPRPLTKSEMFTYGVVPYLQNLRKITGDNTNIQSILLKKGFYHKDLHDQNVLITKDKKGNLIVKLIDLGKIIKLKPINLFTKKSF